VKGSEAAVRDPPRDRATPEPGGDEVGGRHDAVLPRGEPRDAFRHSRGPPDPGAVISARRRCGTSLTPAATFRCGDFCTPATVAHDPPPIAGCA
jgi:hypothetical protein